jgi:hypothetical protein
VQGVRETGLAGRVCNQGEPQTEQRVTSTGGCCGHESGRSLEGSVAMALLWLQGAEEDDEIAGILADDDRRGGSHGRTSRRRGSPLQEHMVAGGEGVPRGRSG